MGLVKRIRSFYNEDYEECDITDYSHPALSSEVEIAVDGESDDDW